jgi:signal transduction histidine kinase/ligand-binding sensor protein
VTEANSGQAQSRIERLFGDLETFDLILASILRDWGAQGAVLPRESHGKEPHWLFDDPGQFADYCARLRDMPGGKRRCWDCDVKHAEEAAAAGKPIHYICDHGLLDVAVPIIVRGQSIATILFGQRRISDDPKYRSAALRKVRSLAKELGVDREQLMKAWSLVPEVTMKEVRTAKSDVERFAAFVAEIVTEREELNIVAYRSARINREVDKLSLTNLDLKTSGPMDRFWQVCGGILESLCDILDARAALVLKGHGFIRNRLTVVASHPEGLAKSGEEYCDVSDAAWQALTSRGPGTASLAVDSNTRCGLREILGESSDKAQEGAAAAAVALQASDAAADRVLLFFIANPAPQPPDMRPWLPLDSQQPILDLLASRLAHSYGAVLRYSERLAHEEQRRRYTQDVTHQLVGPLSGLRAHCENLIRGRLGVERGQRVLATLVEQAGLLQHYAENVALAARAGHSIFAQSEYRPETLDSRRFLRLLIECAMSFQGQSREKGLRGPSVDELSFRRFPDLEIAPRLFKILMINLYDNAIKYSYETSPITVVGRVLDDTVEISITNHGIPLYEDQLGMIFERHTRAPQAEEAWPIGTGIGLFICSQIIQLHGGTIRALPSKRSPFGNEVTFVVTLPFKR